MAVSFKFLQELPSKLEIQCKKGMYFSFDFGWYFINLDIVHALRTGWGRGVGLTTRQNLLSMTKVSYLSSTVTNTWFFASCSKFCIILAINLPHWMPWLPGDHFKLILHFRNNYGAVWTSWGKRVVNRKVTLFPNSSFLFPFGISSKNLKEKMT